MPFVDSDEKIEASTNCSINDIFIKYGEQAFRDIERRMNIMTIKLILNRINSLYIHSYFLFSLKTNFLLTKQCKFSLIQLIFVKISLLLENTARFLCIIIH
ncbi:MAG: hypothetical protein LBS66_01990 [Rhodospirillaceae bacterium]|nr:hypothetical protein [Rhodospirillaceae bacterium]